jgi:hypothetical protein
MRKISNNDLLDYYVVKHNIQNIFDKDILKYAQLHFYEKGQQEYIHFYKLYIAHKFGN